jgi:hypothetical protein
LTGIGATETTSNLGEYVFPNLDVGMYRLTVTKSGFKTVVIADISVQVEEKRRVDIGLQVGGTTEKVFVTAESITIDTDSSTVGSTLTNREVLSLPLNGREFSQLALLEPGVSNAGSNGGAIGASFSTAVQVGGTSSSKNDYTVDGMDNNFNFFNGPAMNVSIDAVQEFRIDSSIAPAEYGRGGAQLHLVTRGGGNDLHGALWDYFRNSSLNGGNYITHHPDGLKRNQFGASLGGPLRRNKAFFFLNWESQREASVSSTLGTVFTDQMRMGDLSQLSTPVINPQTGLPFPNNQIPTNDIDPVALSMMSALIPKANLPGIAGNYVNSDRVFENWNQGFARIDYRISEKDDLFFEGTGQGTTGLQLPLSPVALQNTESFTFANTGVSWTRSWSPTVLSETRFSFHQERIAVDTAPPLSTPTLEPQGFGGKAIDHLPTLFFSNFSFAGQVGNPLIFKFPATEFVQNVSFNKAGHLIKAGFTFRHLRVDTDKAYTNSSWPELFYGNSQYSGSDVADYLLGLPFLAVALLPAPPKGNGYSDYAAFVQDQWTVGKTLTLNLGIRYDLRTQPVTDHNIWASFDPTSGKIVMAGNTIDNPFANPLFLNGYSSYFIPASQTNLPQRTLAFGDHNDISPRIGFAWRPLKSNTTVLRGGYGIYYILPDGNISQNEQANLPFGGNLVFVNTHPQPSFTTDNPFTSSISLPTPSAFYRDPHMRDGYLQQMSLGIEHQLPWNMVATANYQHQHSLNLEQGYNVNQPAPGGSGPIQPRRPFPNYVALNGTFQKGFARYDDLEVLLRKSSVHNTFQVSYTWAKNIDDANIINIYDPRQFVGPDQYVPQAVKINFVEDLPFGKGMRWLNRGGALNTVLGGWTAAGITTYQHGLPLTVTWAGDSANVGVFTVRPDRVGSGRLSHPTEQEWFDTSAFVAPTPGTFGNSGTGILYGPSAFYADFSVHKNFLIRERLRLQFRSEFFNVFNHPNEGTPQTLANGFAFGQILTKNQIPRVIQFALRIEY